MKKKLVAVELHWIDAHGGDEGWAQLADRHSKPARIRSVGMLARKTEDGVVLVLSFDPHSSAYGGYLFVPAVNIVSIKELS